MANQLPPNTTGQPYGTPQKSGGSGGSSVIKILLIVFGVLAIGCVCCVGAGYFGFGSLMSKAAETIVAEVKDHQIIKEQLGGIKEGSAQIEIMKSGEIKNETGVDTLIISVEGTNGKKAEIHIRQHEKTGKLVMADGQEFDLGEIDAPIQ